MVLCMAGAAVIPPRPHGVADGPTDDSFEPVAPAEVLDTVGVDEVGFPRSLYIL